jgi:hypothetical protein
VKIITKSGQEKLDQSRAGASIVPVAFWSVKREHYGVKLLEVTHTMRIKNPLHRWGRTCKGDIEKGNHCCPLKGTDHHC